MSTFRGSGGKSGLHLRPGTCQYDFWGYADPKCILAKLSHKPPHKFYKHLAQAGRSSCSV